MSVKTNAPRRALTIVGAVAVAAALGFALLLWRGPEPGGIDDAYALVFGKADLGDVDFATLKRRSSPNDALICPKDVCRAAVPDREPPVFALSGERLRALIVKAAQEDPQTDHIFAARWEDEDRFLARTRLMRFPDTINSLVIGAGDGLTTLALYSRSQIGYSDMGVNRARIERWLSRIEALAAAEKK